METHCGSLKGRVSMVVLHAEAVMAPWEDAGTRHVGEESTWSGLALSSTLRDLAKHLCLNTVALLQSLLFSLQLKANCCKYEGI